MWSLHFLRAILPPICPYPEQGMGEEPLKEAVPDHLQGSLAA